MIFEKRWQQNVFIVINLLIIGLLSWWGVVNAIKSAKSKALIKDGQTIVQGFEYFKKDQNRYPFTSEFGNVELLKEYLTNYPATERLTVTCEKNFEYFSNTANQYELRICLPKAAKGYPVGWSVFSTK